VCERRVEWCGGCGTVVNPAIAYKPKIIGSSTKEPANTIIQDDFISSFNISIPTADHCCVEPALRVFYQTCHRKCKQMLGV